MADYATIEDLEARWRPLSGAERGRAEALLGVASRRLRALAPGLDDDMDAGLVDPELVTDIVCDAVRRAMSAPGGVDGPAVQSTQVQAGPFGRTQTFANPVGDLYFTRQEKALLGIGSQQVGSVPMGSTDSRPWWWWLP